MLLFLDIFPSLHSLTLTCGCNISGVGPTLSFRSPLFVFDFFETTNRPALFLEFFSQTCYQAGAKLASRLQQKQKQQRQQPAKMQWSCSHSTSFVPPHSRKGDFVSVPRHTAMWPCSRVSGYLCICDSALLLFSDSLMPENQTGARKLYRSWPFAGGSSGSGSSQSHLLCSVSGPYACSSALPPPRSIIMISVIIIMPMPMPNRGVQFRSELKSYHFDSLFFQRLLVWWVSPRGRFLSGSAQIWIRAEALVNLFLFSFH